MYLVLFYNCHAGIPGWYNYSSICCDLDLLCDFSTLRRKKKIVKVLISDCFFFSFFFPFDFLFVLEFSVLEFKSLGMGKLYFCNVLTMKLWKLECGLCCWNFLSYSKFL